MKFLSMQDLKGFTLSMNFKELGNFQAESLRRLVIATLCLTLFNARYFPYRFMPEGVLIT